MSDDTLTRVFARLQALRDNLPAGLVPETFVAEYHKALGALKELGYDTDEWAIPVAQIAAVPGTGDTLTGPGRRFVAESYFRMQLDTVLAYFTVADRPIGFRPPSRYER